MISNIDDLRKIRRGFYTIGNTVVVGAEVATTPTYLGTVGDDITIIIWKDWSARPTEWVADYRDTLVSKGKAVFYILQ